MATAEHRIRVSGATELPAYVAARGGSTARVLQAAGLVAAALQAADGWLPLEAMADLYEAAARELDDPCFGLAFGPTVPLRAYGLLSYVVLNAADVSTALENLCRYSARLSVSGAEIDLMVDGDAARLAFALPEFDADACRQYVEATASILCVMMTALVGDEWKPREIAFAHSAAADVEQVERILAATVRYGASRHSITFDAACLGQIVPHADRNLLPLIEKQIAEVLGTRVEDRLVSEVRNELARVLCDGKPDIRSVARRVAMSPRTLQRRLQACGVRFKTLVNQTRVELAKEYLVRNGPTVTEIALLLGYGELSAFDRAFRRETGTSPTRWRRDVGARQDSAA